MKNLTPKIIALTLLFVGIFFPSARASYLDTIGVTSLREAAILLQAALRGDGGSDTNSAADMRTLKALLLNGAVKPIGWTNSNSAPLDTHYGAGVLNVLNSYEQLAGGKNNFISATTISPGDPHPPDGSTGTISKLSGWDFNSIASADDGFFSTAADGVNHYFFNVTNNA